MGVETAVFPFWHILMTELAVPPSLADAAWEDVKRLYGEDGRFYHTLSHIQHALQVAESIRAEFDGYTAVQLAIWFHDIIYDPHAANNEEESAAFAHHQLQAWLMPSHLIKRVQQLILATKSHAVTNKNDADIAAFIDVDLAILGADTPQYTAYSQAIRKEYAFVPEQTYRKARAQILNNFLNRSRIFQNGTLYLQYEAAARKNIKRELLSL